MIEAQPIDFQQIFPNDIITVITPDSLQGITRLMDTDVTAGTYQYFFNLPSASIPENVQTLYVIIKDYSGIILGGIQGTITNPDNILMATLNRGFSHIDGAYGDGWSVHFTVNQLSHVIVGYGPTLFSGPAQIGLYDLSNYDAVLRIYDNSYIAYIDESNPYSTADFNAISEGFANGLSFFYVYNYLLSVVDKPFVHMYTDKKISASTWYDVPGIRTLSKPAPEGNGSSFGWKDMQLLPNSMNEHVYEAELNNKLNFVQFSCNGTNIDYRNNIDAPLYDMILVRSHDPQHYEISVQKEIDPGIMYSPSKWQIYTLKEAREFLQQQLYTQSLLAGLSEKEAQHFVYVLPWVDVMLLRAVQHPDQYFCFYRFNESVYDRLIPVNIQPSPSQLERNMWVMLSNIQPRPEEPTMHLSSAMKPERLMNNDDRFIYREYGMVDERYSINNSTRDPDFYGVSYAGWNMMNTPVNFYNNPFASELVSYLPTFSFPYGYVTFNIEQPPILGVFYNPTNTEQPVCAAKTVSDIGRLLVLGTSYQFGDSNQHAFLNAAMNSLIHSPNLVTGIEHPVTPTESNVTMRNYPNPFNPETTIEYIIPSRGLVTIDLYNIKGQLIKHLLRNVTESGIHTVKWNGLNDKGNAVGSQVILCKMQYNGKHISEKIVLMK